ncbi:protein of unknown function [Reichenbachiella faecimaris]|uniref:DUF4249 domain-containing protein n=1 Tax=Reichenbachiella faecimaris TaxID=692418 RepID=A0A1W2GJT3_REIFA|nr:DUF4249 domain-containing protein [Reichenbachiella faecimaris]SMD36910.1 protein of unknown function [Reichenbachiella faecimaris]
MRYLTGIISIVSCFLISCVDEIDIPLSSEAILTIEGSITDETKNHKIQLSHSYSFNDNPTFAPIDPLVFGAQVEISDNEGNVTALFEGKNGAYYTPAAFAGEIGKIYTLRVTLKTGEVYFSKPERILPVGATIEEVCFENTVKQVSTAESTTEEKEVQFTAKFNDNGETNDYYRWGYTGVYEVEAPLADTSPPCDAETQAQPAGKCGPCNIPTKRCWASEFDNEFLKVESDELFNGKTVDNYVIYSTSANRQFNFYYAAHIEMYSLTKAAFDYYDALSTQLTNNGTVFETPNFQIRGNVYSEEDPEQLVLGYFSASAKTTTMLLVDGNEIPDVEFQSGPINCSPNASGCIPATCIDCRSWPAINVKPSYWP